jgi:hypothetical protein
VASAARDTTTESARDPGDLLERAEALSLLAARLREVTRRAGGRMVVVGGEAGVGKTALIRRFCADHRDSARVLTGNCDVLFTPRPLGPVLDVADAVGGELAQVVAGGAKPHEVVAALGREVARNAPTVIVLEDVHQGDGRRSTSSGCSAGEWSRYLRWCS